MYIERETERENDIYFYKYAYGTVERDGTTNMMVTSTGATTTHFSVCSSRHQSSSGGQPPEAAAIAERWRSAVLRKPKYS